MSTEKRTPDDETEVVPPVAETQPIHLDEADPDDAVDETELTPAPESTTPVDATQPLDDEPQPGTPDDADPFDLFPAAPPEPSLAPAEPYVPPPAAEPSFLTTPAQPNVAQPVPTTTVVAEPTIDVTTSGRRRLRVGTVVWGLILAAFGLGVIAWASGARIDFQLALIVLLAVAGTALLVGSILSGARHARR